MRRGFTLLELLIVVIIIGILASLALPNFFRGVERARWAEAKSVLGSLRGAQLRYYAQYGAYTATIGNLDVQTTVPKYFSFTAGSGAAAIATGTRNANQDGFGLSGSSVQISEDGNFNYTGAAAAATWTGVKAP